MSQPTIGRTVLYRLTKVQADQVSLTRRRAYLFDSAAAAQKHEGNPAQEGDVCPLVVTLVASDAKGEDVAINGQVLLDGNDSLWVVGAKQGDAPGEWQWPVRA